jgi:uncharacterized protein YndB with AHSA1/START domain
MSTDERSMRRIAADPVGATLAREHDRWVLTMSRRFGSPPERVWRMLTEPDELARWSPVVPDRPLDTLGPARSRETPETPEVDVEVLVCDPPRELVHRWGTHLLRWTLTSDGDGTRLTLADTLDEHADGSRNGAGWHMCLAVLGARLDGEDVPRIVGPDALAHGYEDLQRRYDHALT